MTDSDGNGSRAVLYVVAVVGAVLVAAVLAPVVLSATQPAEPGEVDREPGPTVAVLSLRGGTNAANVNALSDQLREARTNESIEAVVLRVDSSGGPVSSSEELYLAVNRTAADVPVVAYVEGAAASGGYFGISPVDSIFVKPSSTVGSIGVIISAPLSAVERVEQRQESFIRTGPDKAQISKDGIRDDQERLKRAFVGTIMTHRGDELTLTRQEVANGSTYLGTQAVQNGFADRVGGLEAAIADAANRSDAIEDDDYSVIYRELPQVDLASIFARGDVERIDGNIVYIDDVDGDESGTEFVRPVRYYAVWGVPADLVADRDAGNATNGGGGDGVTVAGGDQ
jgi:protease-4